MRFNEQVVIVTGGASGIGEATAWAFVEEGAYVVIADFAKEGQDLADKINESHPATKKPRAHFIKVDVSDETEVKAMISETVERYGRLDIMFANAGIAQDNIADKLTFEAWQKTIDINLGGVFLCDK